MVDADLSHVVRGSAANRNEVTQIGRHLAAKLILLKYSPPILIRSLLPVNIDELKAAYIANDAIRAICDEMAPRQRNQNETKLLRMLSVLENNGASVRKPMLIAGFRELQRVGCGEYVEGRRGWPSRFVWTVESINACRIAQGEQVEAAVIAPVDDDDDSTDSEEEIDTLDHYFNLRADFQIEVSLPIDLSQSEANRLSAFIQSLPLDDFQ